ncbi:carotenoid oxygenase family protein [Amorphus orientalis]|uniref:Dioxygenase n=1 Tax=Amorphus orientalis TaxID=649198 RepID=A0AAE3VP56_9HYPH|nr:carotenoid oxygenase family protein [Amorphus orientalis]MDQ0315709.1 carotenoid cleavage dioxygenase [Amorphus orientalis]
MTDAPRPEDPSWHSDDPHLSGVFTPVAREVDVADLTVVAGRIPEDLSGAYMRNGPNPLFQPLSYTYPLDGDGMIHAVYFDNGRARYRNRFVETRELTVERRAGHAVWGGLMAPRPIDPALLEPGAAASPFKNGAFISVLAHGGHLLALGEAEAAYEMTMELETVGEWTAGTESPLPIGAHNRHHPTTGDLFAIAYDPGSPDVQVRRIDPSGRLADNFAVRLPASSMIHDFVLTEKHVVLLVGPAIFDFEAAQRGGPILAWRPELGTTIAVMELDGSAPTMLEAEPFFVYHFANGFERGGSIVIDYVRHPEFSLGPDGDDGAPHLHRLVLDPATHRVRDIPLADFSTEFPRVNDRLEARATRFVYVPRLTGSLTRGPHPSATFNTIVKVDTESGTALAHDLGEKVAGEPVFIPKPGASAEDDGYLAVFATDPTAMTSDLVLLDATDPSREPVAVIRMPQRVPQGLHGTWIGR